MTIKLPPLPSGEWEVRWGHNAIGTDPNVKVWLNGNVAIDSLSLSDHDTENDTRPYKLMKGPREFRLYDGCSTYGQSLSDFEYSVRVVLGRIQSDGKSDNYLRMKALEPDKLLMIDYLEFCPASVCDNQEIPEE